MSEINPIWAAVVISGIGGVFQLVMGYVGMKVAQAKFEARQESQGQHLGRLQDQVTEHGGLLGDHAVRIGVLENQVERLDFPRR